MLMLLVMLMLILTLLPLQIFVMNNYFGLGLKADADAFSNADAADYNAFATLDLCDEQLLWFGTGRRPMFGFPQRQRGEAREVQLQTP